MTALPHLFTASKVAAHLGTSTKWVRRQARNGRLPYYVINERYYFAADDVNHFVERNRIN